jgi:hypothetical protein
MSFPRIKNLKPQYILFLREKNLLKITEDGEYYVDLQLPVGITPEDEIDIGVNVGAVKEADGRPADGLLVTEKTLEGKIVMTLYTDNGEVLINSGGEWSVLIPKG